MSELELGNLKIAIFYHHPGFMFRILHWIGVAGIIVLDDKDWDSMEKQLLKHGYKIIKEESK